MAWVDHISDVLDHAERLDTDLEYFAEHNLKDRPKAGGLIPFVFNPVQCKLHAIIEKQKAYTCCVRVVVLEGPSGRGEHLHGGAVLSQDNQAPWLPDGDRGA